MTEGEWQAHVTAHQSSGLSKRAYAKRHGVSYAQYWARKRAKKTELDSGFVPVKMTPLQQRSSDTCLGVMEFPNGTRLVIHNVELLSALSHWIKF